MPSIKEIIKKLRKEYGYTQESLAKALGLNAKSSIANYENGSNAPSDDIKLRMCELFNCSMDYLMGVSPYKNTYQELEINQKILTILDQLTPFDIDRLDKLIDDAFNSNGQQLKTEVYLLENFQISYIDAKDTSFLIKNLCMHYKYNYYSYPLLNGSHHFTTLFFKDFVRMGAVEHSNSNKENIEISSKGRAIARGFDKLSPKNQKIYTDLLNSMLEDEEE